MCYKLSNMCYKVCNKNYLADNENYLADNENYLAENENYLADSDARKGFPARAQEKMFVGRAVNLASKWSVENEGFVLS